MGALSPTHWLIIIGVLVLLFGAKRLPDAARSLGRSARILRSEVDDLHNDPAGPPTGRSTGQQPDTAQRSAARNDASPIDADAA